MSFKCEYCNKSFKRESTIAAHMCRNKKRYMQRDVQHVKLGFVCYNDWYKRAMGTKKSKTYDEFAKSQYYGAFVRLGLYILEARILAPEKYLNWLVENQVRVDNWSKDSVYNKYLAHQNKKETAERALERFVIHAEEWGRTTGRHWTEYWQVASINRIVHDIKMGKISPWILLSHVPAREKLNELPDELLNEIADTIDLVHWNRKIAVNKPTVKWIEEILG